MNSADSSKAEGGAVISWGLTEAAAFLRIHPDTLAQRARAGEIPGCKVGRAWVFLPELLREYLLERSVATKPRADAPREYASQPLSARLQGLRARRSARLQRRARP
jgi:excisionase family DNA binding protein